jgi:hypothetical protein
MRFISGEVLIGGIRDLQIAGQDIEDSRHIGGALNVGMAAQRVDAAAGAPHVAQQQLQHGRGADDLRAEAVLRPAHRVDDGGDLLHVAVFADGGEQIGGLQELIFRNAGDALHHLRRVARILLLQQLIDAARMLKREVVSDVGSKGGGAAGLALKFPPHAGRAARASGRLPAALQPAEVVAVIPGGLVVGLGAASKPEYRPSSGA